MIEKTVKESRALMFAGSKGGCGCSFLSYTIATYFARETPGNVLLLDLNAGKKDSRIIFNTRMQNVRDIGDIDDVLDQLDTGILKKLVVNLDNSLNIILPPLRIEKGGILSIDNLDKLIGCLKDHFNIICIDFPFSLAGYGMFSSYGFIDKFIFISLPDLVSVNNLGNMIDTLIPDKHSVDFDLVINKFNIRPAISPTGLNGILRNPVNAFIPYDRDIEFLMLNRGPDAIFNYNLRIVRNIREFSQEIYEDMRL
ncbi:MAG: hypothetical protein JW770_01715 [Actinobacteria bacterium]|nr:hypothetical protein [Actinomycetota bacterium]